MPMGGGARRFFVCRCGGGVLRALFGATAKKAKDLTTERTKNHGGTRRPAVKPAVPAIVVGYPAGGRIAQAAPPPGSVYPRGSSCDPWLILKTAGTGASR